MGAINFSEFYCCKCGKRQLFDVPRQKGRPAGHLKKMFCFSCNQEVNFCECKPYTKYSHEDFLLEFNNGNFDNTQQRILPYGQLRDKLNREGRLYG